MKSVYLGAVALVIAAGCGRQFENRVQSYREQQVQELVLAYQQARTNGNLLDMCVKANLIAGAYLDAEDSGNASAWEARRSEDCRVAREALVPQDAPPAQR